MTTVDQHWDHFEQMAEAKTFRSIGVLPKVAPSSLTPDFLDHQQAEHLEDIAARFSFVLLAMVHFYPECLVYVDSDRPTFYDAHHGVAKDVDVSHLPLRTLERCIHDVMATHEPRMVFYFSEPDMLIRLTGDFDNDIYGDDPAFLAMLERLATSRGLFLDVYSV